MLFACAADASITPAALPEMESTDADVSAADDASGFTVLGEVKPRTLKKVHKISHLVLLEFYSF